MKTRQAWRWRCRHCAVTNAVAGMVVKLLVASARRRLRTEATAWERISVRLSTPAEHDCIILHEVYKFRKQY